MSNRYKCRSVNGKFVREHTLVWEKANGRKLPEGYVIHHIDGNGHNNDPSNLQAMTPSEHFKLHARLRKEGIDPVKTSFPGVIENREQKRRSNKRNRVIIAKRKHEYYLKNKDHITEYKRQYQKENSEQIAKHKKEYNDAHREEIADYNKRYLEKNRELAYAKQRLKYALTGKRKRSEEEISRLRAEYDRLRAGTNWGPL